MEAEWQWSCYGGVQFKRGRMVMLQRQPVYFRGNGRYRSGQFKGGRMVKLQKWSV